MQFDIIAVTKLAIGVGVVWLIAMGAILLYLKREKRKQRRNQR